RTLDGTDPVTSIYDADDLLIAEGALTLVRDPHHGLVTGTALGPITTSSAYTGLGELIFQDAARGGSSLYTTVYGRDDLGRITELTETLDGVATSLLYRYDAAGRLVEVLHSDDGPTELIEQYAYDSNGNRTSATVGGTAVVATYDDQDRLLTYGDATFTHTD